MSDYYPNSSIRIENAKRNFINAYQNHKDFLGCGIGKMHGDFVLHVYVKDYKVCGHTMKINWQQLTCTPLLITTVDTMYFDVVFITCLKTS